MQTVRRHCEMCGLYAKQLITGTTNKEGKNISREYQCSACKTKTRRYEINSAQHDQLQRLVKVNKRTCEHCRATIGMQIMRRTRNVVVYRCPICEKENHVYELTKAEHDFYRKHQEYAAKKANKAYKRRLDKESKKARKLSGSLQSETNKPSVGDQQPTDKSSVE